ncbi:MAG: hypothetical protein HRU41_03275 [Saprospiraceae bacterium]|nr:hypothetical protein [Saprospiraceae bacterium]
MPGSELANIRELIRKGKIREGLDVLLNWVETNSPADYNYVIALQSRLNSIKSRYQQGVILREENETEINKITAATLDRLTEIEKRGKTTPKQKIWLNDYHQYTCNRSEQDKEFKDQFRLHIQKKAQFYYLYGAKKQSHEGFFTRLCYEIEGRLNDYLRPDIKPRCKVVPFQIYAPLNEDLSYYKENILKKLFDVAEIEIPFYEVLLEKNILNLWQDSPILQHLGPKDFVCIYIKVSPIDWNPNFTPQAARWLIHEFCGNLLTAESPIFLFFFGVQYHENQKTVKSEVEEALAEAQHLQMLPALDMVSLQDIIQWFEQYDKIEPDTEKQKEIIKQNFPTEKYYMTKVEKFLCRLITEYNTGKTN